MMREQHHQQPKDIDGLPGLRDSSLEQHSSWNTVVSLCPECLTVIPGVLRESSEGLVMEKACREHGSYRVVVSTDLNTYRSLYRAPRRTAAPVEYGSTITCGCPNDCGLCPDHDQHTCLAILEITSRCDLQCPICLAGSSVIGSDLEQAEVESALAKLIRYEGRPCPIQLSGGEPTLHPDLIGIVRLAASLGFKKIEVDTNGLRLARERGLACSLREAGLTGVYLQLDGLSGPISEFIRGRDLVEEKLRAVENCRRAGLQVVLSVTVVQGVNDQNLWEMVQFGAEQKLTGVNFQAIALSGRFPQSLAYSPKRFTQGHFILGLEEQSGGKLRADDLTPIPCPDTRCGMLTYALLINQEIVPLKRLLGGDRLFDFAAQMSDWEDLIRAIKPEDSIGCGCDGCGGRPQTLEDLLPDSDFFSIGYHGMMDAYSLDLERVRRCCVHSITAGGTLIPFCLYNIKYRKSFC